MMPWYYDSLNRSVFSASLDKIPFDSDLEMKDSATCVGNISLSLLGLGYISQDNITVRQWLRKTIAYIN